MFCILELLAPFSEHQLLSKPDAMNYWDSLVKIHTFLQWANFRLLVLISKSYKVG